MSSQASKSSKPSKPTGQLSRSASLSYPSSSSSSSSSLSSHLAMVELKQRILTSLSKLSDRDTHQIAVQDLENLIQTLSNDGVLMLLNCLFDATNDPKPAVKKESLRLLAVLCAAHREFAVTHLTKIIANVVKRLKDTDTGVRDACRDAIGSLSGLYLKDKDCDVENGGGGVGTTMVSVFAKPFFEAMNENNKVVQGGAAICMSKMVDCASDTPVLAFQKLCPRICKFLNSPNFMARASLLAVVSSLSQVGAIAPQSLEPLLQSIHECLGSSDWATRKAAADTLIALASHSSNLIAEGACSTLAVLEACRFDKIKPVRDSITEALQLWKNIAGKGDGTLDDQKASSHEGENAEGSADLSARKNRPSSRENRSEILVKDSSDGSSPGSVSRAKPSNISDKTAGILRKKAPALSDKELNPDFFHKLETRGSDDLPVEVVLPRRCLNANEQNPEADDGSMNSQASGASGRERDLDSSDVNQRESSGIHVGVSGNAGQSEGFLNNKLNWLAIQKQLLQMERQQAHLMNMLQDFMGGSHDSMVTLENRVRGLERIVEDMARDLTISTGRRGSTFTSGFEGSSNRPPLGKYNGFPDYSNNKLGRGNDGRVPFNERFAASDGVGSGMRGRAPSWRADAPPEHWDFHSYAKNGIMGTRRAAGGPKSEDDSDGGGGSRRGWDKSSSGSVRFGEGPSARSVWQASKDEATLEAIRVAGDDNNGVAARGARVAIPELTAEALADEGSVPERDPIWTSWTNAMDALHVDDIDLAFAEVLSTGDELLLLKLMGRSGPVIDQLSNETANEVLQAVSQFLLDQNLLDICLSWVQQLIDIAMENGPDALAIPMDGKREILLNLHEAVSLVDPSDEWEGATPDQLLLQLAAAWEIDLDQLEK